MFKGLAGCHPFLCVFVEKASDEFACFRRKSLKRCDISLDYSSLDCVDGLILIFSREGHLSSEHDIGNGTDTPHITAQRIATLQHLRSHVFWGTAYSIRPSFAHQRTQTPIDDLHLITVAYTLHQDILWLNIAVGDFLRVRIIDCP